MNRLDIEQFVLESWAIEGLVPTPIRLLDLAAFHCQFLPQDRIELEDMVRAAQEFAQAPLRDKPGMDVRVGSHMPPRGGPDIAIELCRILEYAHKSPDKAHFIHCGYETIHPFMDGNGRTGRLLWAWCMNRSGIDPAWLKRGFLHTWYYQSLQESRP